MLAYKGLWQMVMILIIHLTILSIASAASSKLKPSLSSPAIGESSRQVIPNTPLSPTSLAGQNAAQSLADIKTYLEKILQTITSYNEKSLKIQTRTFDVISTLFSPSCQQVETTNSVSLILPMNSSPKKVKCEDGWTVILSRSSGTEMFNRSYAEYETGFGNPAEEYYIGNSILNVLTSWKPHHLRVELEDFKRLRASADYGEFKVAGAKEFYKLTATKFDKKSSAGDGLKEHNGMRFSTYDNSDKGGNCAQMMGGNGGWWYNKCYHALGTGVYRKTQGHQMGGVAWFPWHQVEHSLKSFKMLIKPKV